MNKRNMDYLSIKYSILNMLNFYRTFFKKSKNFCRLLSLKSVGILLTE